MSNVLVIGDTHMPFEHEGYLDFCLATKKQYKCNKIVHIGDLVDNHGISYHEHDPDGWSPADEMEETDKHLAQWFKAFPKLVICRGNHDALVDRKGKTAGLPRRCFNDFRSIWNLPDSWYDGFEEQIDGVLYKHGTGFSGQYAHLQAAISSRQSTAIGHLHSIAGVEWTASSKDCIFGMSVGCGIDRRKYAFAYGKDFKKKPILGCGVVTDSGRHAQFVPMELG